MRGDVDLDEKIRRCKEIDFLAPLSEPEVRRLLEASREVHMAEGEVLFEEGDSGQAMYVVLEGTLLVYKDQTPIARPGAGTYVGEMALVESKVRSASVKAIEPTTLLEVTEEQFRSFIVANPASLLSIMKTLSMRSRNDLAALDTNFRRLQEYSSEVEQANRDLQEARQELMRTNRELERLSTLDTLTGLANRRRFDVALRHEWRRASLPGAATWQNGLGPEEPPAPTIVVALAEYARERVAGVPRRLSRRKEPERWQSSTSRSKTRSTARA